MNAKIGIDCRENRMDLMFIFKESRCSCPQVVTTGILVGRCFQFHKMRDLLLKGFENFSTVGWSDVEERDGPNSG